MIFNDLSKFKIYDPTDGLKPNTIKYGRLISKWKSRVTPFSGTNVYIQSEDGQRCEVGIFKRVDCTNRYKSSEINSELRFINRRT